MTRNHIVRSLCVAGLCASGAAAQLSVSVQAVQEAGAVLERADKTRVVQMLPSKVDLTRYTQVRIREQGPYASVLSYVYPPFQIGSSVSNRVKFANAVQVLKKSGHASLHTTDRKSGAPGVQRYRVTLTTTKSMWVKIDLIAFGNIYDASTYRMVLRAGATTRTWTRSTSGQVLDTDSLQFLVNGTMNFDVEMSGTTKPGTGNNAASRYEGFSSSLAMNFLAIGNGSFKTYGVGCAKGKISSNGVPVRGSWFEVRLTGERPNTPAICLFGDSKDRYGSLKLPLAYGAAGCYLNVGITFPWAGITDASGNLKLRSLVPVVLPSATFYVQWLVVDLRQPNAPTSTQGAAVKY